ncbi:type I polyketide synthase [Streptomyces sp. NEAU-S77]|uniref:type I polyketide synthase n=1 Tax=Streptomyces sp. NEAU-S77 TaxID=3411033 RepID=UPI003BA334DF
MPDHRAVEPTPLPFVASGVPLPWPLSARSRRGVRQQARLLRGHITEHPEWTPEAVGDALARGLVARSPRAVALAGDPAGFARALDAMAQGRPAAGLVEGDGSGRGIVFVFPGQGAQWAGMARELLDASPVFAAHMLRCEEALAPYADWSLEAVIRGEAGAPALTSADIVQPALFAVMVSLAELWRACGIEPDAVVGHSLGEVAAACVAGALTLEDAVRVAALWSKAQATLAGRGEMVSVLLPEDEVRTRLEAWGGRLRVAAINGPAAVTVSGDVDAAVELLGRLGDEGVHARRVDVGIAAHSPHIDQIIPRLRTDLAPIRPITPDVPVYSSLLGGRADGVRLDADYWCRNLRGTVRFAQAVEAVSEDGHQLLVEVSPHPVLTAAVQATTEAAARTAFVQETLRRDAGGPERFLRSLSELYVHGANPDWSGLYAARRAGAGDGVQLPQDVRQAADAEAPGDHAPVRGHDPQAAFLAMSGAERRSAVEELVAAQVAVARGATGPYTLDPRSSFQDLGFDSVTAVGLRDRLQRATGLVLPPSLAFDHPTPAAVVDHLDALLTGRSTTVVPGPGPATAEWDEPIVIVGMGCRYPGGADSPEELWRLLADETDAVSRFPDDRGWDAVGCYDPQGGGAGTYYQREAGFLHSAAEFDAPFFGISPREALAMDPQQRLLLETSWEALERAGIDPTALRGSRTGVYVGVMTMDYGPRGHEAGEPQSGYVFTGNTGSVASGRLSYILGLEGPSMTVDTACSSSLVALHQACQSLRQGECGMALAGGATVMPSLSMFVEFSRQRGLAPDGRCKAFADAADGFGLAEGVGMVVLERLSDARRLGHEVLAVVRGSAVNHDGASNGLTAPNGPSQERVIRQALANAGVVPGDVDAVEAHGTGTRLGDPIEAQALLAVYGQRRERERPLWLGSLKSNIGHAQAAAGVGGVIKMVLAMRHGVLPRTLHADAPTTRVDWSQGAVELLTEPVPWPEADRPRRAAVSSFGVSGTNAHLVLEHAPDPDTSLDTAPPPAHGNRRPAVVPWPLSARTPAALRAQAERLHACLSSPSSYRPVDVGNSLATTRTVFPRRAVMLVRDADDAMRKLSALTSGEAAADVLTGSVEASGKVVFVFPGQGSQWQGMALRLMAEEPVFAARMHECARALSEFTDWSLLDVLGESEGSPSLDRVDVVQPALFAVMVSLAELWRSYGVEPDAVVGHSQGEIAAACVAGGLTLHDAARVVALRSRAIREELAGQGGMMSLSLTREELTRELERWKGSISLAVVNGPSSAVVSGEPKALEELLTDCEARGIRARLIPVDYASHSPQVESIRHRVLRDLEGISPRSSKIPFYSSVTGERLDSAGLNAAYWYRNLRQTVEFASTVCHLAERGHTVFIEASPHPVLVPGVQDTVDGLDVPVAAIGTLKRDEGGADQFLRALAHAHVSGAAVDWTAVYRGSGARRVGLPTYAFQRERYWLAPARSGGEVRVELPSSPRPEEFEGFPRRVAEATTAAQRTRVVLDEVCAHVAAVLGWSAPGEVEIRRAFRESGFDSLTAVELRNRLAAATGVNLSSTVVFDHPTPLALAEHLRDRIVGEDGMATVGQAPVAADDPVAIVSTSCRFPGDVRSPEELWQLLLSGRDPISGFPADRGWPLEDLSHPDPNRPGTSSAQQGGFLYDAAEFDAEFFGISPREAVAMDPQQRLLLETSWEALERAGLDPASLRGGRTGVFVGAVPHGYGTGSAAPQDAEGYLFTGAAGSVASGRVAYSFGLTGPAITVDTACSSSLVALHLAVQSLRQGECSLALVGGVTVMAGPAVFTEFSHQRVLAPDGRCKPFAAAADGTAWSEGVGVIVLERLSDARRNGHQVLAVVRGSAVNQDGASNGLTAPNGPSQQRVIRQALANARLPASEVDVVEAHGTGTALGDRIEAEALLATYGQGRPQDRPVLLGSVKSNIGHTSAAAGVAGVIKMVLAMRHGTVPATLHVAEPTPHVDWESGAAELVTEHVPWPETGRVRRAAVSSFGISGTNAHVILEQAAATENTSREDRSALVGALPWVVSGRSADALRGQAARLRAFAAESQDAEVVDVGWSLASTRASLKHRAMVVADGWDGFLSGLDSLAAGEPAAHVVSGEVSDAAEGVVFVFPGQGSQWVGMATELLGASPVFAASVEKCAGALAPHVDWDVLEVLRGEGPVERDDVVQPVLWAVMVSLAEVWRSVGVRPSAVIGHSQGEIAAACVAGALSLEDGALLVALRSRVLAEELSGKGGMVSVAASADRAGELIVGRGAVWIAAVNGPESTVVAGDLDALAEVSAAAAAAGLQPRKVGITYASHTPHAERVRERLLELAAPVTPRAGEVPMYSTVTAAPVEGEALDGEYWYRNLRERVLFHDTVGALLDRGDRVFLEVSPHPVLTGAIQEAGRIRSVDTVVTGTLRRGEGGPRRFLASLAQLWVHGTDPDWARVFAGAGARRVDLPTYAFQTKRYWLDASAPRTSAAVDESAAFWEVVERQDLDGLARTLRLQDARQELTAVLPALSAWHRRHQAASEMESWRYRVDWKPLTGHAPATLSGTWLVAVTREQIGGELYEAVAGALRDHGAAVEPLVAPEDGHPWADVIAAHTEAAGVLSLLAGDDAALDSTCAVPAGFGRTLLLIQALEAAGTTAALWCLTQGAVSVGGQDPLTGPTQALVWGLGRVAGRELPARWGGLVDLPPAPGDKTLARLCAVLNGSTGEDQVAVRPFGAFGRRIVRAPLGGGAGDGWTPDNGTVLITGGTGVLGGQIARRLAAQGAEHLLLVSRRGQAAPGAADLVAELTAAGAEVTVAACDIADAEALRDLLESVPDTYPLTAVVHTAAVLDDGPVTALTLDQIDRALRVKAEAAWRLHELTQGLNLSAFVLFSSLAGVVGMAGQGNYAPGNTYVDALAHLRRSRGLVATSVAWGPWAHGGMAEGDAVTDIRTRHGVALLPPESAVLALETAIGQGDTAVVIADIDWGRFAHAYTATRTSRLLDELPEARQALGPGKADDADVTTSALRDRLAGLSAGEREQQLFDVVRAQAAAVLGHDSAGAVDPRRQFLELGLDSVTSVELRNRLGLATGLRLPATVVFDHPSVADLARHLQAEMFSGSLRPTNPGDAELGRLEDLLTELPDGDPARAEIAGRLRHLLWSATGADRSAEDAVDSKELEAATNEEIFDFIEKEFGIS